MNKFKKIHKKVSKFKPFSGQYNWKKIEFPSHKKDWEKFELNNKSTSLNNFPSLNMYLTTLKK